MFKKILLLLTGNFFTSVAFFVRTIIVARLISIEDFGTASTFMIMVTIVQLMSNLGLQQMIIQDDRGDDPEFQKALQGFQLLRGVSGSILLFLLAWPMARFLGNEEITFSYQLLALIPLLNGFQHFDVFRVQRHMRYWPLTMTQLLPPLLSIALLWPLDWIFGDYRVMLWAIIAQTMIRLVLSHIMSDRPYRLNFDRSVMTHGLSFGWPLLLNGGLLFLVFQGEKMIVGRELGMATLAIFSMGLSLIQSPSSSVTRAVNQFLLPQLSATKGENAKFSLMSTVTVQANLLVGVVLALSVVALGVPLVHAALGQKYQPVITFLLSFTVVETIRAVRACTSQVALARARTGNGLAGNLPRVLSIPISWALLIHGYGLAAVLAVGITAELCGFVVGLLMMSNRARVPLRPLVPSIGAFLLFLVTLGLYAPLGAAPSAVGVPDPVAIALMGVATVIFALTMGPLMSYLRSREMATYTPVSQSGRPPDPLDETDDI